MPSCIGQGARYGVAEGTPPPELMSDGRFRDRTLSWFSVGEQLARDECAQFEVGQARSRRPLAFAVAIAVVCFGLGALLTTWLS